MPPRIPTSHIIRCCRTSIERPRLTTAPLASLFAALSIQNPPRQTLSQARHASILSDLRDNRGAYNKRIRKGRGASSGYGKTSGRGHKGQGQHGKVKPWFQGGQTPLIFKHGRMGFVNHGKENIAHINLTRLQAWIDAGRIDPTKPITPKELIACNLIGRIPDGIKLLAHGRYDKPAEGTPIMKQPIDIIVSRASAKAIQAIESAGGKIVTRYYTKEAIRNLISGKSVSTSEPLPVGKEFVEPALEKLRQGPYLYRLPDPVGRWHIEYYRDPAHRGYLSHQLKPGESPSLFFRVPSKTIKKKVAKVKEVEQSDKKLFQLRKSNMSLFGTSPPDESPSMHSSFARSRASLFDEEDSMTASQTQSASNSLFQDDASPWDMPTPRKQKSRADLLRNLLSAADAPDSYIETFDTVVRDGGGGANVSSAGVSRVLAAAALDADAQAKIMSIIAPAGGEVALGRNEFNVLLALVGLAQEGETVSLDSVDERRRNLPQIRLPGITDQPSTEQVFAGTSELGAKLPQRPVTPPAKDSTSSTSRTPTTTFRKPSMDYQDDPWNTPDVHKNHKHSAGPPKPVNGEAPPDETNIADTNGNNNGNGNGNGARGSPIAPPSRTTSTFTTAVASTANDSAPEPTRQSSFGPAQSPSGAWGSEFFGGAVGNPDVGASPFGPPGGSNGGRDPGEPRPGPTSRTIGSGRTGSALEENIIVSLMPEKEGMFMFQHHNYEVASIRRGSKVIRRYSDFVWLLDCLHKRYPFRILPLLPPKRVAVNGNHLSNDGAFIEKRRRGLARFLNALVRHPILSQEQLVIMFLTVPTELSVWRKQANLSVQDEFAGRALPPGLEDSLSPQLEDLFIQTRAGVRRSAELYINVCSVMDRLVKRNEGVAADHARIAMSLTSLTETTADTYATDTNEVPLLNDGLVAMSKHLRTSQTLMEDEARAWDEGVLEDLKRQRDALVSLRDLFDRRERLDRDNIPYLEKRIQSNETKLANLRGKPEGMVKPGEIEKVVEAIIKDKESIVNQHNRSVFVKECIRDELIIFQSTQYHVSHWNQDWAQERVKYSEMLADNWRRLMDELEGMPLGD
ncbi:hypothetical protein M406DRAFT_344168 [Cryphonectria parasitica EP155]|uniref:Sorting nexin MVP1 n=1 Tax=Cryphonectria parasitica (strain ATCC 38755 / EP155) TaxID=660469 RepID=A0A9P5CUH9_CRYP1|nr:uncharacterized protein M406DRAFT_344168 [Cryphonectria parasitica EP155]KAF3770421.1 hypothetical protein M406DRAFT_344168 [Cryphonectria parasitica EP155]